MNERLRKVREIIGISQEEFGKRIGAARNTIANYELGRRVPSNTTIMAICNEFNLSYLWLTEGIGDIFTTTPESVVEELAEDYKLDEMDKKIIEKYLELSAEQRDVIKSYLKSILE